MGGTNVINPHYKYHQDLRGFLHGIVSDVSDVSYLAGHLFSLQGAKSSVGLVLASQRSSVTVLLVILSTHWVTTMARPPPQDTEHLVRRTLLGASYSHESCMDSKSF